MRTLRISVRGLVEFLLRSGDIDAARGGHGGIEAMQAGSDIHRKLQAAGGAAYQAEVPLACSIYYPGGTFNPHAARLEINEDAVGGQEGFFLRVEGRADGIVDDGTHPLVVDEIKGTSRDVSAIEEPDAVHEAQALCYAYLYLRSTRGSATLASAFCERVVVRITYASMTTGEVRQVEHAYAVPDIECWFFALLEKAQRWASWRASHDELRNASLGSLAFPFEPRDGQRQIMDAVTSALREEKRLYVQAPTGSGKTIATLFPTLGAMVQGSVSHIAYLTAKTTTRKVVLECLNLFRRQHIVANVLVATAREKICPLRDNVRGGAVRIRPLASLCNPCECPLARGHYDLVNDALFEAITTFDVLDGDCIRDVAARHHVCPYELQRDLAKWSDIIICDYHYAFAPSATLFGLADEPGSDGAVFLVDEAHNLVERMRNMYSAEVVAPEIESLGRLLPKQDAFEQLAKAIRDTLVAFPRWDKALPDSGTTKGRRRRDYKVVPVSEEFEGALAALADAAGAALQQFVPSAGSVDEHSSAATVSSSQSVELFLSLRDTDFMVRRFLAALGRGGAGYVSFFGRTARGEKSLKIFCVDPSHDLEERLEQAKAAVFFSGTLLPMDYHRKLLAAQDGDASLYARSSFDHRHLQVLIGSDISAKFSQRGPKLYARVASYLVSLVRARPGNYLVFLPSYAMMEEVESALLVRVDGDTEVLRQQPGMRESDRERFIARFRQERLAGTSLMGLCVLGGIFGESIDLPGNALVGVVVVGTGMPQASAEREVTRDYFDAKRGKGFAYAYTYPGMIKVLQAAGRVIRTEEDYGLVLLLDDRFLEPELRATFPKEWEVVQACTLKTLPRLIARRQERS